MYETRSRRSNLNTDLRGKLTVVCDDLILTDSSVMSEINYSCLSYTMFTESIPLSPVAFIVIETTADHNNIMV